MNRQKILALAIGILGLVWLVIWISSWWGTVTLNYDNKPLPIILRSFTQQSGLKVITDIDPAKPVTIHVRRVPVTEALDALQAAAESRGRLLILLAPDAPSLQTLLASLPTPPENSGIRTVEYRTPWLFIAGMDDLPIDRDPRKQTWKPEAALPPQLLPNLESAARATEVRILLPETWNPTLKRAAQSGPIGSSLPALAKIVNGVSQVAYLLPARRDGGEGGPGMAGGRPDRGNLRWSQVPPLPPEALLGRLESRIAALPASEQADARKTADESIKQYREWSSLTTEEERDKKRQEIMNDPARAERAGDSFARGMRRMTPEQRSQRYQRYIERRSAIKSGQK